MNFLKKIFDKESNNKKTPLPEDYQIKIILGDFNKKELLEIMDKHILKSNHFDLIGTAFRNMKEYDLAEKAYLQSIELLPNNEDPYCNILSLYILEKKYTEIETIYQKGISNVAGRCFSIHYQYARAAFAQEKYNVSKSYAMRLINLENPDDADNENAINLVLHSVFSFWKLHKIKPSEKDFSTAQQLWETGRRYFPESEKIKFFDKFFIDAEHIIPSEIAAQVDFTPVDWDITKTILAQKRKEEFEKFIMGEDAEDTVKPKTPGEKVDDFIKKFIAENELLPEIIRKQLLMYVLDYDNENGCATNISTLNDQNEREIIFHVFSKDQPTVNLTGSFAQWLGGQIIQGNTVGKYLIYVDDYKVILFLTPKSAIEYDSTKVCFRDFKLDDEKEIKNEIKKLIYLELSKFDWFGKNNSEKKKLTVAELQKKYEFAGLEFSEGLLAVCNNDKWGFVNEYDEIIIPLKYDFARNFSEGLALVSKGEWVQEKEYGATVEVLKNSKSGFIDKTGKEVIPLQFDIANDFENGRAKVKLNGEEFYINIEGEKTK